jgi:hypothetical protein
MSIGLQKGYVRTTLGSMHGSKKTKNKEGSINVRAFCTYTFISLSFDQKFTCEAQCKVMDPLLSSIMIRPTASQEAKLLDYCFSIKPDCAVYRKAPSEEISGMVPRLVEFFIEFKSQTSYDPFHIPPAPVEDDDPPPAHFLSRLRGKPMDVLGQLGTYAAVNMDSQYRTHSFLVLIIGDYARLMRWDRCGIVFTEPIYYDTQPEFLEFFEAYDRASLDVRGHDSIISDPKDNEKSIGSQVLSSSVSPVDNNAQTFLVVSLRNEADHASPHRYIIPSPSIPPSLPVGRCTRTSVAYDLQNDRGRVYMKSLWRIVSSDNDIKEGKVYQALNKANVKNIPNCVAFCDFEDKYHQTQTHGFVGEPWLPQEYSYSIPYRRFHCIILDTEGQRLQDFTTSKMMVRAIRAAIIGMCLPGCDLICQTLTCVL